MKQVGIIGSYGGGSIGDEAILKGLLSMLDEHRTAIDITVFTGNDNVTRTALGKAGEGISFVNWSAARPKAASVSSGGQQPRSLIKQTFLAVKKASPTVAAYADEARRRAKKMKRISPKLFNGLDVLIFGGGNVLMDIYPTWVFFLQEVLAEAKNAGVPVVFLGVGAGPLKSAAAKHTMKKIVSTCFVSVRDQGSADVIEKVTGVAPVVHADLALGLFREHEPLVRKSENLHIGVTVVPYYADFYWPTHSPEIYKAYTTNMGAVLDAVLVKHSQAKVTFFATNYPADEQVARQVQATMKTKDAVAVNSTHMSVEALLDTTSEFDLVLGTRLHSLILSLCAGTNVVAANYQPKVNYFIERINKPADYLSMKKLSQPLTPDQIEAMADHILAIAKEGTKTFHEARVQLKYERQQLEDTLTRILADEKVASQL
ncbi:polysaccharide pyruvyl transferase family protein [Aureibacillus halotolerans]|uniref:Polysaccharide pyruvyl transferase WcaK-like protein n=1 Tax=Aureibacillus halotolerans TaxID=1508390 RepID=A0A4R6U1X5_9BACI|nr:polysaccharide pyruvyl transferase family protein [Aureibacillus halotolerans]TDQ38683.1 polysaccharide pyruvyl transferase WcaK-like protein [Aureibacillus halotolerans]